MKNLKQHSGKIIAVIIFLVVLYLYKLFFAANQEVLQEGATAQNIGADIIQLNSTIDRVNLDPALFSAKAYRALVDFSTDIVPQPVGRKNPFDLLGR